MKKKHGKWPNLISNPIHRHVTCNICEHMHDLSYILSLTTLSISSNKITHRKWPIPISNPIHRHVTCDICEHMHDLSYTQIQFQIPIPWLNIISISSKQMTYRKWPNPISNPIHGFDNIHDLRYKPIQFQIPIPSRTTLSISSNKTAHRKWPDPISNPIYGHTTFDIFEHMHDLRYTQIQFQITILGLIILSISTN